MAYKNIEDSRAAIRRHYYANKEAYLESNRRNRERINAYLIEEKSKPCTDCGNSYPYYVMDFDHLGHKKSNVAEMKNTSLRLVKIEVAKCELVCANCHRIRTHLRRISSIG